MPAITPDSQEQLATEIANEFSKLAEMLVENASAYKQTYEINKRVVQYIDNSRLLLTKPKEMVDL